MDKLLKILRRNGMMEVAQLALLLDQSEAEVEERLRQLEEDGVIKGYRAVIDFDETEENHVEALVDLKVTPRKDCGFDYVADKIAQMKEVDSLYLMSGGYDLSVHISGKTFQDIAMMVAKKLSTIDGVTGTATHFVLKKYKEDDILFCGEKRDERGLTNL